MRRSRFALWAGMVLAGLGAAGCQSGTHEGTPTANAREPSSALESSSVTLDPANLTRVGTVDERFQSYNVEMIEVTGGKFWKPYGPEIDAILKEGKPAAAASSEGDTPAGMDPRLYQYLPPIDLTNARLRKLAGALGPAYVRVSGTWANTSYFAETEQAPTQPPSGFIGVLTRRQWKGVVDFSKAVDAEIVTSFATGVGTRDSSSAWRPEQAVRLVEYTKSLGGRIAAAEYMNEPNLAAMGGAPNGYTADAYGRDFKVFREFARQAAPDMLILGPGSVGETTGDWGVAYGMTSVLKSRDLLAATGPGVDAFSYHHYGAASIRCTGTGTPAITADAALSEAWLRRTDETLAFYRQLRDEFEPGKPFWLTETADAACGGNPWGGTFLDTFRYLDQLGRLARQDVRVHMHNTLVASDYGLLDDRTLAPKPNYWGALLWRKLMGATVLDSGVPIQAGLHVYAHCLRGTPGGVALLVINNDKATPRTLTVREAGERYTLSAGDLQSKTVQLNGSELALGTGDELPNLTAVATQAGSLEFAPATITFIALPGAGNSACR